MSVTARQITPAIERKLRNFVAVGSALHAELSNVGEVIKHRSAERSRAAENLVELDAELKDATTTRRWNRAGADEKSIERRMERARNDLASEQDRDAQIAEEIEALKVRQTATRDAWSSAGNIAEAALRLSGSDRRRIEQRMGGTS